MIAIGIDPGLTGAVAAIRSGHVVEVWDTPTVRVGRKRIPDVRAMDGVLTLLALKIEYPDRFFVAIETQQPFPGQGLSSTGSIMRQFGIWEGLVAARGWSYELVRPQRWKKAMLDGLATHDKYSSRIIADRLFPGVDLGKRKDQGRADALLLAAFVERVLRP